MVEDRRRKTPRAVWRESVDRLRSLVPNPLEQRRRAILERFQEIPGNTPFVDANIVCLGEKKHELDEALIGEFIRAYARSGDIVLVEGVGLHRRLMKNSSKQEAYQFPRKVEVFGWDNLEFFEIVNVRRREIDARLEAMRDNPKIADLSVLQDFMNETNDISIRQRNLSMKTAIDDARLIYPNRRVFVIAGVGHFTKDQQLTDFLERDKYVVLRPK